MDFTLQSLTAYNLHFATYNPKFKGNIEAVIILPECQILCVFQNR